MKNLYEIIDSLIELTATKEFGNLSEDTNIQLDNIIDDLIHMTKLEDSDGVFPGPVPDLRRGLSQEEFEYMLLFEKLIDGMMNNRLAMA